MENQQDLGPLTKQVQRWWSSKHRTCTSTNSNSFRNSSENLSFLFRNEDLDDYVAICPSTCSWRGQNTSQELVLELQREVKPAAVKAARLLNQPDVEVAEQVASALMPTPYGNELTFVTDLVKAAGAQSVSQRWQALTGAGLAGATFIGLFLLGLSNRKAA